jgi:hypothetical protein
VDKFFRWLFGNSKEQQQPEVQPPDMMNTAPLSEQQLNAIVNSQNPRFELQQLLASCGQSVGTSRKLPR